jgi:hypothetical protein
LINTQSSPPLLASLALAVIVPMAVAYSIVAIAINWFDGLPLAKMKLQIAIAVLGLAWIPVPEKWAFVYGWTVRY